MPVDLAICNDGATTREREEDIMSTPVRITFRHMRPSAAAEENIRGHVQYLERLFDALTSCRVVIDAPPSHRNKGGAFSVHVELTMPGREIFVSTDHESSEAHRDVYVAIRDAFEAAKRQLDAHVRRQRGDLRSHSQPSTL
jgi:ribosome-associated translation inhibitor RaiA